MSRQIRIYDITTKNLISSGKDYLSYRDHVYFYRNPSEFFYGFSRLLDRFPGKTIRIYVRGQFKYEYDPNKDADMYQGIKITPMREILQGQTTQLMRQHINQTKNYIFKKLRGKTLLSIGAGRGGDILRWNRQGFTKVVLVEPNEDNIRELRRRLRGNKLNFEFKILNVPGQETDYIMKETTKFLGSPPDVVSFMLSLSFFNFEDRNQVRDLIRLMSFGRQVAILTQDLDLVDSLVRRRVRFKRIGFRLNSYNPPKRLSFTPGVEPSYLTRSLSIHIPDSIVEDQEEYLVNTNLIIRLLGRRPRFQGLLYNRHNNFFNPDEANLLRTYRWLIL